MSSRATSRIPQAAIACLGASALTACAGAGEEAPEPVVSVLSCEHSIGDGSTALDSSHVIEDAIALEAEERRPLQVSDAGAPDTDGWLWAKQGIVVRAGASVELRVPDDVADDLRFDWGYAPLTPATTVRIECPGEGWLAFPGGYWVSELGCYPVIVVVDERAEARVEIGIGEPCTDGATSHGAHD